MNGFSLHAVLVKQGNTAHCVNQVWQLRNDMRTFFFSDSSVVNDVPWFYLNQKQVQQHEVKTIHIDSICNINPFTCLFMKLILTYLANWNSTSSGNDSTYDLTAGACCRGRPIRPSVIPALHVTSFGSKSSKLSAHKDCSLFMASRSKHPKERLFASIHREPNNSIPTIWA